MKMRRCNTREPTLLSAMVKEGEDGCTDGNTRVRAIAKPSLFSVGRHRHRQQRHQAQSAELASSGVLLGEFLKWNSCPQKGWCPMRDGVEGLKAWGGVGRRQNDAVMEHQIHNLSSSSSSQQQQHNHQPL